MELRVERHILWVGSAAAPVRNISWVEVFRLKPAWGRAAGYFLVLTLLALLITDRIGPTDGNGEDTGSALRLLLLITLAVVCGVLLSSRKPVLVVELNSGSRLVLTRSDIEELRAVAGQLVYAMDHPEYEFSTLLEQHNTTNNFGSVVHMNGGKGNTGIKL